MTANSPKSSNGASNGTRTAVTIILLIFFWPAGLILMWAWAHWPIWVKILITAFVVIIPILAILAIVGLTVFAGTQSNARDARRIAELTSINDAVTSYMATDKSFKLCGNSPAPCVGNSDQDGQSWLKPDIKFQSGSTPVDSLNTPTYHYTYCSDGKAWELDAKLESPTFATKAQNDGGDDPNLYELGSNLTLCPK